MSPRLSPDVTAYSEVCNHRYLQFFFNSALVVLFLYLLVQFILTVQRDVEQRISEYSMGKSVLVQGVCC